MQEFINPYTGESSQVLDPTGEAVAGPLAAVQNVEAIMAGLPA